MEIIWVVLVITFYIFSLWRAYKLGFKLGYVKGAEKVLEEWKKTIKYMGDDE